MSSEDLDGEQSRRGGVGCSILGCLVVLALLGAAGGGLAYLLTKPLPTVSSNGARIVRYQYMGPVHALQLEAGQLRVISARGSVYGETATGLKRLTINGGVLDPYAPTYVGGGDLIALVGNTQELQVTVVGGPGSRRSPLPPGPLVIATASDGGAFALLSEDGSVQVRRGEVELSRLPAQAGRTLLAFQAQRLLIGGEGSVEVYDETGALSQRLSSDSPYRVTALGVSPEGRWAAVARSDERITIWNLETGARVAEFTGGDDFDLVALAFSPDGESVAAGSARGLVQVWGRDGTELLHVPLDRGELSDSDLPGRVRGLAFDQTRLMWAIEDRVYEYALSYSPN